MKENEKKNGIHEVIDPDEVVLEKEKELENAGRFFAGWRLIAAKLAGTCVMVFGALAAGYAIGKKHSGTSEETDEKTDTDDNNTDDIPLEETDTNDD